MVTRRELMLDVFRKIGCTMAFYIGNGYATDEKFEGSIIAVIPDSLDVDEAYNMIDNKDLNKLERFDSWDCDTYVDLILGHDDGDLECYMLEELEKWGDDHDIYLFYAEDSFNMAKFTYVDNDWKVEMVEVKRDMTRKELLLQLFKDCGCTEALFIGSGDPLAEECKGSILMLVGDVTSSREVYYNLDDSKICRIELYNSKVDDSSVDIFIHSNEDKKYILSKMTNGLDTCKITRFYNGNDFVMEVFKYGDI